MIRAIILDYVGVLVPDFHGFYVALSTVSGKSEQEVKDCFARYWSELKLGKMSDTLFWQRMRNDLGISPAEVLKMKSFTLNMLKVTEETLRALRDLGRNYYLYLLSNSARSWSEVSFTRNKLRLYFRKVFFSHRIGLAKPSKEAYSYVLKHIPLRPEEILFVDDSLKNMPAAQELGLRTILFKGWNDLFRKMQTL